MAPHPHANAMRIQISNYQKRIRSGVGFDDFNTKDFGQWNSAPVAQGSRLGQHNVREADPS